MAMEDCVTCWPAGGFGLLTGMAGGQPEKYWSARLKFPIPTPVQPIYGSFAGTGGRDFLFSHLTYCAPVRYLVPVRPL